MVILSSHRTFIWLRFIRYDYKLVDRSTFLSAYSSLFLPVLNSICVFAVRILWYFSSILPLSDELWCKFCTTTSQLVPASHHTPLYPPYPSFNTNKYPRLCIVYRAMAHQHWIMKLLNILLKYSCYASENNFSLQNRKCTSDLNTCYQHNEIYPYLQQYIQYYNLMYFPIFFF